MNIQQLMKQAQQMQKKLQENQENLEKMEFEGQVAGEFVSIIIQGNGFVKSIKIKKEAIDPEDKETLEDLIQVAFNEATKKLKAFTDSSVNDATGGMKLPFKI